MPALDGRLAVLRRRDYRLLLCGQGVSVLGDRMVTVALAFGLAMWGPISAAIGVSSTLWIAFGLFIACVLALLAIPDVRRLPAAPEPAHTA